jgi:hypothetical protein
VLARRGSEAWERGVGARSYLKHYHNAIWCYFTKMDKHLHRSRLNISIDTIWVIFGKMKNITNNL